MANTNVRRMANTPIQMATLIVAGVFLLGVVLGRGVAARTSTTPGRRR